MFFLLAWQEVAINTTRVWKKDRTPQQNIANVFEKLVGWSLSLGTSGPLLTLAKTLTGRARSHDENLLHAQVLMEQFKSGKPISQELKELQP